MLRWLESPLVVQVPKAPLALHCPRVMQSRVKRWAMPASTQIVLNRAIIYPLRIRDYFALFSVPLACLLSSSAIAESPNWTFVEASYLSSDIDIDGWNEFGGIKPDGFELAGSVGIGDWVFLDLRYSEESDEIEVYTYDVDFDFKRLGVGAGVVWGVTDTTDLYGRLAHEDWSVETCAIGYSDHVDENGFSYAFGARSILWEVIELRGELNFIADEHQFTLGAYYTFLPYFALGASYTGMDHLETLRATLRFNF